MGLLLQDQRGGSTQAVKEKVLYLNILAAKGATKRLLGSEHVSVLFLVHSQTPAKHNFKYRANKSKNVLLSLTVLVCQHCSVLPSARQMMKYCSWGSQVYF